jgi:hypothetical protein
MGSERLLELQKKSNGERKRKREKDNLKKRVVKLKHAEKESID